MKGCNNSVCDTDPRDEALRTVFAETAILMTHPDETRRLLAKERVYALLLPASPALTTATKEG